MRRAVNEHFIRCAHRFAPVLKHVQPMGCDLIFNAALATQVIIQRFPNALLTGKLGAQRVIFPSAATCYASIQPETRSLRLLHPDNTPIIVAIVTTMDSINIHF